MKTINKESESRLSHIALTRLLTYNIYTGVFTWNIEAANGMSIGQKAGTIDTCGHIQITINGRCYFAHRLAWFYIYKKWPNGIIDHIDNNPQNNVIDNLRDVNQSTNLHNAKIYKSNTSGVKGVNFNQSKRRWEASITINRKRHHIGTYIDFEMAVKARREAESNLLN